VLEGCSKVQTRGPAAAKLLSPNVLWAWNSVSRSVRGRAEPTSTTLPDQVYVINQVRRCLAGQRRQDKARQFEVDTSLDWKPVQRAQHCGDEQRLANIEKRLP